MQEHLNVITRLAAIVAFAAIVVVTMALAGAMQGNMQPPTQQVAGVTLGTG